MKQAFGSAAGKTHLAPRIIKLIPRHTTYVEPYAGGAAVFWDKTPSKREILNDKNREIMAAYRFIKGMSAEQLRKLKTYDWTIRRSLFNRLKNSKPKTALERFRRFYYIRKASFKTTSESFNTGREGKKIDLSHLLACKQRLAKVTLKCEDGATVIRNHDGINTFFYVDPPYPGRVFELSQGFNESSLTRLIKSLDRCKGKFILSLGTEHEKLLPKRWHVKRVKVVRRIVRPDTGRTIPWQYEILAANYKI